MRVRSAPRTVFLLLALLLVSLAVVAGGCGSSSSTSGTAATTGSTAGTTGTTAAETTTTAKPEPTGKVVIGSAVDAATFDPIMQTTVTPEWSVSRNVFDTLVYVDNDGNIQPQLAESWELENDTTWIFKLRKDVKFHNGEVFNAEAAKYSFDRAMSNEKAVNNFVKAVGLKSAEVVDEYTLKLVTEKPASTLLARMNFFSMVAPKYYSESDEQTIATKPVGTGPYKVVEWVKNDHIDLEANMDYWGPTPTVKEVVFRILPEIGTRVAELQAGGIDIAGGIPVDLVASVKDADTSIVDALTRRVYIGFRFGLPSPVDDIKVRQAINYAVDIDTIAKTLVGPDARRSFTLAGPQFIDPSVKPWPYDPEKAKALLKEAGYENGFEVTLDNGMPGMVGVAQAVADYLTKVGIKTTLRNYEWGEYVKMLVGKTTGPMFLLTNSFENDALIDMAAPSTANIKYPGKWEDPTYEKFIADASAELDLDARAAILSEAQIYANEQCPWIWMYFQPAFWGVNNTVNFVARTDEILVFSNITLN